MCVVTANDVVSGGVAATDDVYERISCYTDVKWSKDSGTIYSHSASGYFNTELFYRTQFNGLYSFEGFWEELRNANHSVTKNFVLDNCLTYGLINDSYVYHSVTVSSAAELEKLIADENVYDLIPVKAEIKAMISGIYITSINNFRKAPVPKPEKKGMMAKLRKKADDMTTK